MVWTFLYTMSTTIIPSMVHHNIMISLGHILYQGMSTSFMFIIHHVLMLIRSYKSFDFIIPYHIHSNTSIIPSHTFDIPRAWSYYFHHIIISSTYHFYLRGFWYLYILGYTTSSIIIHLQSFIQYHLLEYFLDLNLDILLHTNTSSSALPFTNQHSFPFDNWLSLDSYFNFNFLHLFTLTSCQRTTGIKSSIIFRILRHLYALDIGATSTLKWGNLFWICLGCTASHTITIFLLVHLSWGLGGLNQYGVAEGNSGIWHNRYKRDYLALSKDMCRSTEFWHREFGMGAQGFSMSTVAGGWRSSVIRSDHLLIDYLRVVSRNRETLWHCRANPRRSTELWHRRPLGVRSNVLWFFSTSTAGGWLLRRHTVRSPSSCLSYHSQLKPRNLSGAVEFPMLICGALA